MPSSHVEQALRRHGFKTSPPSHVKQALRRGLSASGTRGQLMLRIVRHDDAKGVAAPRAAPRDHDRIRVAASLVDRTWRTLTARKFALLLNTLRSYEAGAISEGHTDLFLRHILLPNAEMTAEYEALMGSQRPLSFRRFYSRVPVRDSSFAPPSQ